MVLRAKEFEHLQYICALASRTSGRGVNKTSISLAMGIDKVSWLKCRLCQEEAQQGCLADTDVRKLPSDMRVREHFCAWCSERRSLQQSQWDKNSFHPDSKDNNYKEAHDKECLILTQTGEANQSSELHVLLPQAHGN